jgi:hypothetical protein
MNLKTVIICLVILFIHWIADFVFQTDEMAKGKSKNWDDLLDHTSLYTLVWAIALMIYGCTYIAINYNNLYDPFTSWAYFALPITFVCHTATDYYTSRINAKLYAEGKIHEFFVSVGFDQLLHFIQLFLTFYLVFK